MISCDKTTKTGTPPSLITFSGRSFEACVQILPLELRKYIFSFLSFQDVSTFTKSSYLATWINASHAWLDSFEFTSEEGIAFLKHNKDKLYHVGLGINGGGFVPYVAHLTKLTSLSIAPDISNASLSLRLAKKTNLTSLEFFNVSGNLTDLHTLQLLPHLKSLKLECLLGNVELEALVALTALTCLDLSFMNSEHLISFAQLTALAQLTDLNLSSNIQFKKTLLEVTHLTRLRKLSMESNALSALEATSLLVLPQLTSLNLAHNNFPLQDQMEFNSETPLQDLDISHCNLFRPPPLSRLHNLTRLNYSHNNPTLDVLSQIVRLSKLQTLVYHDLKGPPKALVETFSQLPKLAMLEVAEDIKTSIGPFFPHLNIVVAQAQWR